MSYLHDDHDAPHEPEDFEPAHPHREFTLSTGTILAIFFGLVLVCGAFFAFGYNMGTRAHQAAVATTDDTATGTAAQASAFDHFSKPSPGAPAIQPVPGYMSSKEAAAANQTAANTAYNTPTVATSNMPAAKPAPIPREMPAAPPPATPATHTPPSALAPAPPREAPTAAAPATPGTFVVQIAAVSHQEDADMLVSSLKRKGYAVAEHTEPADHLFHVQVGPFPNKKDAEAMRQKLLTDGYMAILK